MSKKRWNVVVSVILAGEKRFFEMLGTGVGLILCGSTCLSLSYITSFSIPWFFAEEIFLFLKDIHLDLVYNNRHK
jgi:hypothetical protein